MRSPDLQAYIEKGFWTLALIMGGYISNEIRGMSNSIQSLNEKIAVVVVRVASQDLTLEKIDRRIAELEKQLK